jgi:hypothetical protein
VLLFLLSTFVTIRSGGRGWGVVVGLGIAVLAGALGYGAGIGLLEWVSARHAEAGSLAGAVFHGEGWYMLSLACAAVTVVASLNAIARRWLALAELAIGAVAIPVGGALWLSISVPLGAPNLQWPALAATVSVALIAILGSRSSGVLGWLLTVLLAVPALALLVPLTELLWLAMTFKWAGVIGAMMVAVLLLMLPAIDALRHPNSWWLPVTALATCAAALAIGVSGSSTDAERPAPSTLVYAFQHDDSTATWVTSPVVDSLDASARAWAESRANAPFDGSMNLAGFGYRAGDLPATAAPVVDVPRPTIVVERDTTSNGQRRVELGVRSEIGAEMILFQADEERGTRILSINGKSVGERQRVEHWGVPDTLVQLELEMPAGAAIGLDIVEHLLRPAELLGPEAFRRPADLAPDFSWMSDRAMIKTTFLPEPQGDSLQAPEVSPPEQLEILADTTAAQQDAPTP